MLYNIKIAIAYIAEKQYLCNEIINHLIYVIMKEKLTKNDSMSKSCSQICKGIFDNKTDFDVMVAAFEAFLKKAGAHGSFFKNWAEDHDYNDTANVFYAWRQSTKRWSPSLWINSAFIWRKTDQGLEYWHTMHSMWKRHLKDNLNK